MQCRLSHSIKRKSFFRRTALNAKTSIVCRSDKTAIPKAITIVKTPFVFYKSPKPTVEITFGFYIGTDRKPFGLLFNV